MHNWTIFRLFLLLSFFGFPVWLSAEEEVKDDYVTIAILAKEKAHVLPLYLECIEMQTWPKDKTYLYIRTNNNKDNTEEILRNWVEKVKDSYAGVHFDATDVEEPVQNYGAHEWNAMRFSVLGKIRQDSLKWAKERGSHYFVADCDNFILPRTIEVLHAHRFPIVAPLLKLGDLQLYSNFHEAIDQNGYLRPTDAHNYIVCQVIRGLIEVPVVHCTYFIREEYLDLLSYSDRSGRHEYVIFSHSARKNQISQYLDNREIYGRISFSVNKQELLEEPWLDQFCGYSEGNALIEERNQQRMNLERLLQKKQFPHDHEEAWDAFFKKMN